MIKDRQNVKSLMILGVLGVIDVIIFIYRVTNKSRTNLLSLNCDRKNIIKVDKPLLVTLTYYSDYNYFNVCKKKKCIMINGID